jgi:predicted NAD/FAD-dependent oxidoreductase
VPDRVDVVVVGAGLAGLAAARRLQSDGRAVTVLDKGRSPGGRLATRRIGDARLDHGAQFFTQRGPEMAGLVAELRDAGELRTWCNGFAEPDGHPRYVMPAGMNGLAKFLSRDLADLRTGVRVDRVERTPTGWLARPDDAAHGPVEAAALLLTAPVPQSLELVDRGGVELDPGIRPALEAIDYDAAMALLVVLDGAPALPAPGAVQLTSGPFTFVADNAAKGITDRPALTFHTADGLARSRWDDDDATVLAELLAAAAPWIGDATVVEAQLKRWRYAAPRRVWPETCCVAVDGDEPLILAGDAFDGPRVEGAYRSGLAAATALLRGRAQPSSGTGGSSSAGSKPSTDP